MAKPRKTVSKSSAAKAKARTSKASDTAKKADEPELTAQDTPAPVPEDKAEDPKVEKIAEAASEDSSVTLKEPAKEVDRPAAEEDSVDDAAAEDAPAQAGDQDQSDEAPQDIAPEPDQTSLANETTPAPAAPQGSGSGGFFPLLLGGVLACGLGFVVSELDLLGLRSPSVTLSQQIESLENRLSDLQSGAAATADTTALEGALAEQQAALATLEGRISALEDRPLGVISEGTGGVDAQQLAELQAALATQKSEIESLLSNAQTVKEATAEAARRAAQQSALSEVITALGDGAPYAGALEKLRAAGMTDLPPVLVQSAQTGVVPLATLQGGFADAARAALADARAAGLEESETGLGGFLRRQLGARSVAPREGSSPDAILSRAEAAVRAGQLDEALEELAQLPDLARSAMEPWISQAQARAAARTAAQELSQSLTAQ